jgi:6-phosphofructokinase 2
LIQKNNCDMIVVSLGSAGAIMVTAFDTYRVAAPAVERKSTVGAGDSMVAGIVLALSKGMRAKQVLQYGVACGTAATMNEGHSYAQPRM